MTHMDQLKYKEFISNTDAAIENTKIVNFEMIHAQCRGTPCTHSHQFYQTVRETIIAQLPQKDRKKNCCGLFEIRKKGRFRWKKNISFFSFFSWAKLNYLFVSNRFEERRCIILIQNKFFIILLIQLAMRKQNNKRLWPYLLYNGRNYWT